jgi:hypothetical protein
MKKHNVFPEHEDEIRAKIEWLAGWFDVYPDAMNHVQPKQKGSEK